MLFSKLSHQTCNKIVKIVLPQTCDVTFPPKIRNIVKQENMGFVGLWISVIMLWCM